MLNFLSNVFWLLFWIGIILGIIAFTSYNKLQHRAQAIKEQMSNIQISINKKLALLNQLIDVVRNFQESEQFTHLMIAKDGGGGGLVSAYQQSGTLLTSLQGVAQRFPELRASEQYHRLIDSIQHCENDIQSQRQTYNAAVRFYNSECLSIPTVFVARFMGFSSAPYLEFDVSGVIDVTTLKEFKTDDGERLQKLLSSAGDHVASAGKKILDQAGQASRQIASTVKEKREQPSEQSFFFLFPDGVPEGPMTLEGIRATIAGRVDAQGVKIAKPGGSEWLPLPPA